MRTHRTPRYVVLSFPLTLTTFSIHWGWKPLVAAPHLSISPSSFIALVLGTRLLVDVHLQSIFRGRRELRWARHEMLLSTKTLFAICALAWFLEHMGFKVITYIKPLTLSLTYIVISVVYPAPAAHIMAVYTATS